MPTPAATEGWYVASFSASSEVRPIPSATTPATVAATAETAGTVRVRCRLASRTAYRSTSGSRPDTLAIRPGPSAPAGSSRARPGWRSPRSTNSPPAPVGGAERRPGDADTEQHQAEQRRPQGRRPVAAPPGQHRDDVLPGGQVGRDHGGQERAEHPEAGDRRPGAATAPRTGRTSRRTCDWSSGCSSRASPMPSATPTTAATLPSTTAPADDHPPGLLRRTARRGHQRQAALLLAGADRERRAGQQHHLDQRHHRDQRDHRDGGAVRAELPHLGRDLRGRRRVGDHRTRGDDGADAVELAHRRPRDRRLRRPATPCCCRTSTRRRRAGRPRPGRSRTVVDSATPTIVGSAGASSAVSSRASPTSVALVEHRLVDDDLAFRAPAAGPR